MSLPSPPGQDTITTADVKAILEQLAETLLPDAALNERYVHHAFSHHLQTRFVCLDLGAPHHTNLLHPEWPTYKEATKIAYAKYRNTTFPDEKKRYMPVRLDVDGDAGFIDFAIGRYAAPAIGIEFSLKPSWAAEEVVYDIIKLVDCRNPFTVAFSHNIIIRPNNLATGARRARLEQRIGDAL